MFYIDLQHSKDAFSSESLLLIPELKGAKIPSGSLSLELFYNGIFSPGMSYNYAVHHCPPH